MPLKKLDFKACDLKGCYAQTAVTPNMVDSLRSGRKLILGFRTLAQKPIKFAFFGRFWGDIRQGVREHLLRAEE